MAIKGEVHVKSMVWAPKISLNDGRYVIRPFECKIVGKAEGLARVRASIHTFFAIFDDEEWRIITLFVNHLDSKPSTLTCLLPVVAPLAILQILSCVMRDML